MMETVDEINARHRREAKELTARTTALKKTVKSGAGDKKAKKEVTEKIEAMTKEMEDRHKKELEELMLKLSMTEAAPPAESNPSEESKDTAEPKELSADESAPPTTNGGSKKPNRQKLRKQRKAVQMEEMRRQALEEASNTVNMREVEDEAIAKILQPMNMRVRQVAADGHCLYNAIADQLLLLDSQKIRYSELRHIAASYMRSHPDDFMPFCYTDNGDMFTEDQYQKYCDDVENTAAWGGQLEIQALAKCVKRSIHVIQMNTPIVKIGEEFEKNGPPLVVSYHRHMLGLGEHYNSVTVVQP
ncbi:hypothetical protein BJ742DRAFT_427346 [Cladochytrium replicatum]|nr:hypothetical protein BJ742DRAFT_427346 [Cladochytrium replicatum]